jgi:rRNA maturation RNase YbeY
MGIISFYENDVNARLKQRNKLKIFLAALFKEEKRALQGLDIIFCSDEYLLNINIHSLKHNFYTDIITFEFSNKNEATVAEIYISVDRVLENAAVYKTGYQEELHRVIFHGCLHLCGYGDKKKAEQKIMREKETKYIRKFFI